MECRSASSERYNVVNGWPTKAQKTTRLDTRWPEEWPRLSQNQKKDEIAKWDEATAKKQELSLAKRILQGFARRPPQSELVCLWKTSKKTWFFRCRVFPECGRSVKLAICRLSNAQGNLTLRPCQKQLDHTAEHRRVSELFKTWFIICHYHRCDENSRSQASRGQKWGLQERKTKCIISPTCENDRIVFFTLTTPLSSPWSVPLEACGTCEASVGVQRTSRVLVRLCQGRRWRQISIYSPNKSHKLSRWQWVVFWLQSPDPLVWQEKQTT